MFKYDEEKAKHNFVRRVSNMYLSSWQRDKKIKEREETIEKWKNKIIVKKTQL